MEAAMTALANLITDVPQFSVGGALDAKLGSGVAVAPGGPNKRVVF
jgi:hypothetical protein